MVGVQIPKSRPEMEDATNPGLMPMAGEVDEPAAAGVAETDAEAEAETEELETDVAFAAALVTVKRVVAPPQLTAAGVELDAIKATPEDTTLEDATTADETETGEAAADPPAGAVPAVPPRFFVLKLENPALTMT